MDLRRNLPHVVSRIALAAIAATPACADDPPSKATGNGPSTGARPTDAGAAEAGGSVLPRTRSPGLDRTGFDQSICDGPKISWMTGLRPTPPVDYLEYRDQYQEQPPLILGQAGNACATATDADACKTSLSNLSSNEGWFSPYAGKRYLAFTRGDSVGLVKTLEELTAFLAPIDTAEDAAFLMTVRQYAFPCSGPNAKKTETGFELIADFGSWCGGHVEERRVAVDAQGAISVVESKVVDPGEPNCVVGRRPKRVKMDRSDANDEVARYLKNSAQLEACSIPAFEQLARDLAWHGAPESLVAAALVARDDEVRHARSVRDLASRYGADYAPPCVTIGEPRSLFAIAYENAVEGCLRETFGAIVATMQATCAEDADVAAAYATIAIEETSHAELAWDIASWVEPLLSDDERTRLRASGRHALAELRNALAREPANEVQRLLGVPNAERAVRAFEAFTDAFYAASGHSIP